MECIPLRALGPDSDPIFFCKESSFAYLYQFHNIFFFAPISLSSLFISISLVWSGLTATNGILEEFVVSNNWYLPASSEQHVAPSLEMGPTTTPVDLSLSASTYEYDISQMEPGVQRVGKGKVVASADDDSGVRFGILKSMFRTSFTRIESCLYT